MTGSLSVRTLGSLQKYLQLDELILLHHHIAIVLPSKDDLSRHPNQEDLIEGVRKGERRRRRWRKKASRWGNLETNWPVPGWKSLLWSNRVRGGGGTDFTTLRRKKERAGKKTDNAKHKNTQTDRLHNRKVPCSAWSRASRWRNLAEQAIEDEKRSEEKGWLLALGHQPVQPSNRGSRETRKHETRE